MNLTNNCLGSTFKYFAYGSNMSVARIKERVSSAIPAEGWYILKEYALRFHKRSRDDSGKCNACFTGNHKDYILGVVFNIDSSEKPMLDKAEGCGHGYDIKTITISTEDGTAIEAITYVATKIDENLKPYSWYLHHVLIGADEASLPDIYIKSKILSVDFIEDEKKKRDAKERAIYPAHLRCRTKKGYQLK